MKLLKYGLLGLAALVLLVGAVLAYVAATFDPNEYKPQIVAAVKERTQRTLRLEGEIELAFFPSVGARVRQAALTERASDQEFASVEEIHVAVKLLPLFSRQVIVDGIEMKGLRARVVRYKDGKTSVDDLAGAPAPAAAPDTKPGERRRAAVDIARVRVENARLTYVDRATGARYEFDRLELKTGRIASGVPTDVEASLTARADKPRLALDTAVKARLTFDPDKQRYAIEGLDLSARGAAANYSEIVASVKGGLEARPAAKELRASGLAAAVKGKRGGDDFGIKLEVPRLDVTREKVSSEKIVAELALNAAQRRVNAKLGLSALMGTAQAFSASQLSADIDVRQDAARTTVKLASPLAGSIERERIELSSLTAAINAADPAWQKSPVEATVTGALAVDGAQQTATFTLATKFDESTIRGRVGLARFDPPSYSFDLDIDRLDADRYRPKAATGKPAGKTDPQAKAPEQPIDVTALKGLNAAGAIRIGSLKLADLKASNVRLDIKAADGRLDVNPVAANLYQGSLAGALSVSAATPPRFALKQKLSQVNVGPLLRDLADNDRLEGKGSVTLDLTAQGGTVTALKKAVNGTAAVNLADGAVKGIDIAGAIRSAKARLGALRGEPAQQGSRTEKTDFSELSATFAIRNGVAHNNDLTIKSPLLRIGGAGSVNIGEDSLDYVVKASIVATAQGQGGRELADLRGVTVPVRVSGPLADPSYRLDLAGLATDTVKQKLEDTLRDRVERRLGGGAKDDKSGGSLRDQLKGLFGR